jgi:hypothetical protein
VSDPLVSNPQPPCRYCGQPLKQIYPEARYELRWAHTSRADAEDCPVNRQHRDTAAAGFFYGRREATVSWPVPVGIGEPGGNQ